MAVAKLGELLVKTNVLQPQQLEAALADQRRRGGKLGEAILRLYPDLEAGVMRLLAKQLGVAAVDLSTIQAVLPEVLEKVPPETADLLGALPFQLRDEGKTLLVAMAEPQNARSLGLLRDATGLRISPYLASRTAIQKAHRRFYEQVSAEEEPESSFKLLDSQGKTVVRPRPTAAPDAAPTAPHPVVAPRPDSANMDPLRLLEGVEQVQRKEVGALKALVELMIERGIFTREEYLAKVKRLS